LLTQRTRWSSLKTWDVAVARRRGIQKAIVAVARSLHLKETHVSPTPKPIPYSINAGLQEISHDQPKSLKPRQPRRTPTT
ncbi:MAG: hypothetical protein O6944_11395, partial [Gammaproteobacteria bacterium]|nr:hypothetical protein [Gammaproteobacteria bacterium]